MAASRQAAGAEVGTTMAHPPRRLGGLPRERTHQSPITCFLGASASQVKGRWVRVPSPPPDAILASYAPLAGTKCVLHVSVAKRRSGGGPYALRRCSIWVEELFSVSPYIEGGRVGAGVGAARLGRIPPASVGSPLPQWHSWRLNPVDGNRLTVFPPSRPEILDSPIQRCIPPRMSRGGYRDGPSP